MIRIGSILCVLILFAAVGTAQNISWMDGCWQASLQSGVVALEQWKAGASTATAKGGVVKDGKVIEKVAVSINKVSTGYEMTIINEPGGQSFWSSHTWTSSSITFKELGGNDRKITISRSGSTKTTVVLDATGETISEITYTKTSCK